jgi:hypothetical protein
MARPEMAGFFLTSKFQGFEVSKDEGSRHVWVGSLETLEL